MVTVRYNLRKDKAYKVPRVLLHPKIIGMCHKGKDLTRMVQFSNSLLVSQYLLMFIFFSAEELMELLLVVVYCKNGTQ